MKGQKQNRSSYEIEVEKEIFGRPYRITMKFSPAPADIRKAQREAEALAERMMRDARLGEMFGYGVRFSPTWPLPPVKRSA